MTIYERIHLLTHTPEWKIPNLLIDSYFEHYSHLVNHNLKLFNVVMSILDIVKYSTRHSQQRRIYQRFPNLVSLPDHKLEKQKRHWLILPD